MMSLNNPLFILGTLGSAMAIMTLCLQRKHLLNALLTLEILMVNIFLVLMSLMTSIHNEGLMAFILLTLAACEAGIGLTMLVTLIRAHGNDYVSSLSINKC